MAKKIIGDGVYGKEPPPGYETQATRRALAKREQREATTTKIERLQNQIKALQNPRGCKFCKWLPSGAVSLKYDCGRIYGLKIENEVVSCPKCKRIMAHWEG